MNAREARAKLNEASRCPFINEIVDACILAAIDKRTNRVDFVSGYDNTMANKKMIENYLLDNGFTNIKIERKDIGNGDPAFGKVYMLAIQFTF